MKQMMLIVMLMTLMIALSGTTQVMEIVLPENNVDVEIGENGNCHFVNGDYYHVSETGQPDLPYFSFFALLPPDADMNTINVTMKGLQWSQIEGTWNVKPVGPLFTWDGDRKVMIWPEGVDIQDGKDVGIYESDKFFPNELDIQKSNVMKRQWKMVQLRYPAYRYNPVSQKLSKCKYGTCLISFDSGSRDVFSTSSVGIESIERHAVNFNSMINRYGCSRSRQSGKYVIITTQAIENASAQLGNFVAHKAALFDSCEVITEEEWGGGTGDTAAENIRSWLQSNYLSDEISYVLLIGNPQTSSGDVAMKACYSWVVMGGMVVPTDYYYSELSAIDWDADSDGLYGEENDDFGGEHPRGAEVYVGRIPHYCSSNYIFRVDNILLKTMAYENENEADALWRKKMLLPMKPLQDDMPNYQLGEGIKDDYLEPSGWNYHRVYETNFGLSPSPETTPCTMDNVTTAWNSSDYGFVLWCSHGSTTSAADVMNLAHAQQLDDDHPSFLFQCSCWNLGPNSPSNLAYYMLKYASVNVVGNSQVSIGQIGSEDYLNPQDCRNHAYEYAGRIIVGDPESPNPVPMNAGTALNDMKFDIPNDSCWLAYLELGMYGCPAIGINSFAAGTAGDSDIVAAGNESPDIPYEHYQSETIASISDAHRVWSFTLRDGGEYGDADALPTDISALYFNKGTSNTVEFWDQTIRSAAIFKQSNNSLVGFTEVDEANSFYFDDMTGMIAPDNASETFDLYLTFKDNVVDGSQFQFEITNAVPAETGSSGIGEVTVCSSVASNLNSIDVTVSQYLFQTTPEYISLDHEFRMDAIASDSLGSIDSDHDGYFFFHLMYGSGTLSSSGGLERSFENGICTVEDFVYTASVCDSIWILGGGPHGVVFSNYIHVVGPIYVDADATGLNDGTSWASAYTDFQSALDDANLYPGYEIWVAEGTYYPSVIPDDLDDEDNRCKTFQLVSGISVYGGFDGTEDDREDRDYLTNESIFSGDIAPDDADCYHVFYHSWNHPLDESTTLDGVSITGGKADTASDDELKSGGAMYNVYSNIIFNNCTLYSNRAKNNGGALCMYGGSQEFHHCTFASNNVELEVGGAMYLNNSSTLIDNCTFQSNTAAHPVISFAQGGAIGISNCADVTIGDCDFIMNSATINGGAIISEDNSNLDISNCDFVSNSAYYGGAILSSGCNVNIGNSNFTSNYGTNATMGMWCEGGAIYSAGDNMYICDCVIDSNYVDNNGGGIFTCTGSGSFTAENCIISNNSASVSGGGIYNRRESGQPVNSIAFVNCTITGNSAPQGSGMYNATNSGTHAASTARNCIFWGNTPSASTIVNNSASTSITYSDVQGGFSGTGNINTNPKFVDPLSSDYSLQWDSGFRSPCIDAGDPESPLDDDHTPADMGAIPAASHQYDEKTFGPGSIKWVSFPVLDRTVVDSGQHYYDVAENLLDDLMSAILPSQFLYRVDWYDSTGTDNAIAYVNDQWTNMDYEFNSTQGYIFTTNLGDSLTLDITGYGEPLTTTIPLSSSLRDGNHVGYFNPRSHSYESIFAPVFVQYPSLTEVTIQAQDWSAHYENDTWYSAQPGYTLNYGEMVKIWVDADCEISWDVAVPTRGGCAPEPVEFFTYEEKMMYIPVYVDYTPKEKHEEMAIVIDGVVKGAAVCGDSLTQINAYVINDDGTIDQGEIEFIISDGTRGSGKVVHGYRVYDENLEPSSKQLELESPQEFYYVTLDSGTDVAPPLVTSLMHYPNPFNPSTTLKYSLAEDDEVELYIYNIKGQRVRSLVKSHATAGTYEVVWQGKDDHGKSVASGVYFSRLKSCGKTIINKMLLLK